MGRYVRRIVPFCAGDIPAVQRRLEDMAEKGLFFREDGILFSKFEKGEPRKMRYRLDFCDVAACDIPDDKKEFYEHSGWQVVGDYGGDFVIVCTDDPDAPEIYTEPESLIKPLKQISGKQLAAWIFFFLLHVNINYGALDSYIEVSFSSIVRYLLDFGTWNYIALSLLDLLLLCEAIFHFVSWLRLRRLIKKLKTGGELPQGEKRRFRAAAGKLLCPLAIPAVVLFGLHLLAGVIFPPLDLREFKPVYDLSSLPIPTVEELGMESGDNYCKDAYVWHDPLTEVIYSYDYNNYYPGERFDYRVKYYDMRSEKLAGLLADGIIKDASHANEEPAPAGWVHCAVDKSFELDGAQLRIVCDLDINRDKVQQTLCVVLGDRVMYVYYYGYDSIESYYTYDSIADHAQDFVDCLK